ncbi:VOC family protein [Streptococcus canis]|uniref:VOC family protein n=1 Tax=Streptococcus canis TaxID=1329 RepID=UPI00403691EE
MNRFIIFSAITGDPQETLDFYQQVLKLRLVKQTVNFDDPTTYHLYFANQKVEEGSLMTFFPWGNVSEGVKGSGQVGRIAFRVPKQRLDFWKQQLQDHNVPFEETQWFDAPALFFQDKHKLDLALVEGTDEKETPAILGFHGVVLLSSDDQASREFLTTLMELKEIDQNTSYRRFKTQGSLAHEILIPKQASPRGSWGPGTGHHIAWKVTDKDSLMTYQTELGRQGFHTTVIRDRKYFQSIYLREKGKVILEFATQGPGMTVDETMDQLGHTLQLPKRYETRRQEITDNLPPLSGTHPL